MATDTTTFPDDFLWGAATASYQIEGAAHEDGRGESVWDRFAATPGKVRNGDTGEIACDFYHRYREDIALMKELGLDAFRFSIAWPRVLPEGRGRVNAAGLDFYDRLVDELLAHGIEPFATLFHWDTPQALEDAGGWPARETAEAFVEYAEAVVERLGDRVRHWMTHNEPWVCAWIGHAWGEHAPGRKSEADAVAAAHHLLLSHGWAVAGDPPREPGRAGRHRPQPRARVPGVGLARGRGGRVAGRRRRATAGSSTRSSAARTRPTCSSATRSSSRSSRDGDLEAIVGADRLPRRQQLLPLRRRRGRRRAAARERSRRRCTPTWAGRSTPTACTRCSRASPTTTRRRRSTSRRTAPRSATCAGTTGASTTPSARRTSQAHIDAVERAVADGVPVKGYFVWCLLDNFEWAHGYSKRFGIVYVDYPTLERVPKDSFYWYRDFIASRRGAPRPSPVAAG